MQLTTISELREILQTGVVKFSFSTKSGTIRQALGTTNLSHIPQDYHPKGNSSSPKVLPFYDIEAGGWRSIQIGQNVYR